MKEIQVHIGKRNKSIQAKLTGYLLGEGGGVDLTAENIAGALGYVPADQEDVDNLSEAIDEKQPKGDYALKSEIPSVPVTSVNSKTGAVQLAAGDVGADPTGTADGKVSAHNTSDAAHNDIRLLVSALTERLNALANSTDEDLDQMAEIVAYIKSNKSLIDSITTSKVNVADIIDNLTTSVSNKPLSAKMGVELKKLIDAIEIPTTLPASDVYDWAKQPQKPTYTASEVGLGNVDNVRQYSASNPPPYPVTSVNGQTGAVTVTAEGIGAASTEDVSKLSEAIADCVKTVNGEAPDDNGNVDVVANIEPPKIVASVAEMTDTTKHYVNQETGTIWAYMKHTETIPGGTVPNFTNVFDADTAMIGYRWSNSAGAPAELPANVLSDFIPCNLSEGEHTLRIKNGYVHSSTNTNTSIVYFSSNNNSSVLQFTDYSHVTLTEEADGVYAYKLGDKSGSMFSGYQNTQYIRVSFRQDGQTATLEKARNVIITIDESITYTDVPESTETYYAWTDTGISYAPTFKTDLIGALGEDNVIYLSDNLPSGTYTLKYGDDNYATVGTISK